MIKLSEIPTRSPESLSKKEGKKITKEFAQRLGELQHKMYAEGKYSLLIILQGMDGSGKDGAVRNIFRYCSPTGIKVHGFKKPTEEEFSHDFLWRVHKQVPEQGMIQIFNRSHYEDILIQRVHNWIDEETVQRRMAAINSFEQLLEFDNKTIVFKFYMHLSKEQQVLELQERIDDPTKQWKHNPGDWEEAKLWDEYMRCYEYAINESVIPWHIVPVDQRWYRDYIISQKLVNRLEELNMQLPGLKEK
jgi:PPK2 family polyphosphate:nucleotide phosphotransferase